MAGPTNFGPQCRKLPTHAAWFTAPLPPLPPPAMMMLMMLQNAEAGTEEANAPFSVLIGNGTILRRELLAVTDPQFLRRGRQA